MALRDREAVRVFALATDLHRRGEYDQAVLVYSRALQLDGSNPDIYNNLGVCLRAQGKLAAASACYRRALVLRPNDAGILSNLGNTHRDMFDLRSAIDCLSRAVSNAPQSPEAVYNLGLALRDAGDNEKAITCFESALDLRNDYAACHVDYGTSLMLKGDLAKGYEEFEWRDRMTAATAPEQPRWDGSDLNGKTILVQQEGGMGDVIQFLRYLPAVKEKGANVIVECHGTLARLVATAPGVDKVVIADSPMPRFDVYAPIMSLPRILGTPEDVRAVNIPYLSPPELHSIQLPPSGGRQTRVGFSWAPSRPRAGAPDRSCPVSRIIELLAIPGIVAFSLQTGERAEDLKAESCDALLPDVGSRLTDLADLADRGGPRQVAAAAPQLVTAEPGLHRALWPVVGLGVEERLMSLRPPGEAVALIPVHQFAVDLDAQVHVDPQHLIVLGEEVGAARAPQPQVAGEPASQAGVEADAAVHA